MTFRPLTDADYAWWAEHRDEVRAKLDTSEIFGSADIVPLKTLEPGLHILALSNGPTLAFKDVAMQLLGNLFEYVLAARGVKPSHIEGNDGTGWILLDYFDFIVHVFTPATREFYALERLWGDAERVDISA